MSNEGKACGIPVTAVAADTRSASQMSNEATAVTGMPHALPLTSAIKAHPAGLKAAPHYKECKKLLLHEPLSSALHHHGRDNVTVSLILEWVLLLMQVVVPIWILALYHSVAYAGSRFGSSPLWQQYGAKLQHILSAYQVCHPQQEKSRSLYCEMVMLCVHLWQMIIPCRRGIIH